MNKKIGAKNSYFFSHLIASIQVFEVYIQTQILELKVKAAFPQGKANFIYKTYLISFF